MNILGFIILAIFSYLIYYSTFQNYVVNTIMVIIVILSIMFRYWLRWMRSFFGGVLIGSIVFIVLYIFETVIVLVVLFVFRGQI